MKPKLRIAAASLLAMAAVAAFLYNLSAQKEILYFASVVTLCGTILILLKEIAQARNKK